MSQALQEIRENHHWGKGGNSLSRLQADFYSLSLGFSKLQGLQ